MKALALTPFALILFWAALGCEKEKQADTTSSAPNFKVYYADKKDPEKDSKQGDKKDLKLKVNYLHSDIKTLARTEILRNLRLGYPFHGSSRVLRSRRHGFAQPRPIGGHRDGTRVLRRGR